MVFQKNGIIFFVLLVFISCAREPQEITPTAIICQLEYEVGRELPQSSFTINSLDGSFFVLFDTQYNLIVQNMANEFNMSQFLIEGIMAQESAWNQFALSNLGAKGLMQIIPDTVIPQLNNPQYLFYPNQVVDPALGLEPTIYESPKNIQIGVKYLRWLKEIWLQGPGFKNLLETTFPNIQEKNSNLLHLVIGSYNFGAWGIKDYLTLHGASWFSDLLLETNPTYAEVARFIPQVLHYCTVISAR